MVRSIAFLKALGLTKTMASTTTLMKNEGPNTRVTLAARSFKSLTLI